MSGPTHNYLELAFSDVPVNDVEISVLRLKADEIKRLDENEVARQVKAGVEFACQRVAQKYYVKRIALSPVIRRRKTTTLLWLRQ